MKKTLYIPAFLRFVPLLAAAGLILAACAAPVGPEDGGTVSVDISSAATGEESSGTVIGTARVYLLAGTGNGLSLLQLEEDTPYLEVDARDEEQVITLSGIPVGPDYRVLVQIGEPGERGAFLVDTFHESELFKLSAGATVSPGWKIEAAEARGAFLTYAHTDLEGLELNSLVVDKSSPKIFTATSDTVYEQGSITGSPTTHAAGSLTVNSVSRGDPDTGNPVLVNTDKGIYTPGGGTLSKYSTNLGEVNVLSSTEFGSPGPGFSLVFQRDGGLGGVYTDGTTAGADGAPAGDWVNVDLSDFVSGQPVRGLAIDLNKNRGFAATRLGSFMAESVAFQGLSSGSGWGEITGQTSIAFFEQALPATILSLALDEATGDTLYVGTTDGVWTMNPGNLNDAPRRVPGTAGARIVAMAASSSNDYAFLSDFYLFIRSDGELKRLPFVGGFPGRPTGLAWNGGNVLIAGREGMCRIDPSALALD